MAMVILGVRVSRLRNNEWGKYWEYIFMEYYYWAFE